MKQNVALYLDFNNTPTTTYRITLGFKVKTIHFKSCAYQTGTPPAAGTAKYVMLQSDLTRWQPIALLYQDTTYSASQFSDVSYKFETPEYINGTYTFTFYNPDGSIGTATGAENIMILAEFNDDTETD